MYSFNNIINTQYNIIGREFVKTYYEKNLHGVNMVFELFSPDVLCTVNSDEFRGSYNWLLRMTKAGISRFEYRNIAGTSQLLNDNKILISSQGSLRTMNLWGQFGNWHKFNETFILERNGDSYYVRNYILRTHL
jgi:hypothetical protein